MARTLAAVATLAKEMQASWKQQIMAVSASKGSSTTTAVSGMQHTHTWKQTGFQVKFQINLGPDKKKLKSMEIVVVVAVATVLFKLMEKITVNHIFIKFTVHILKALAGYISDISIIFYLISNCVLVHHSHSHRLAKFGIHKYFIIGGTTTEFC